MKGRCVNIWWAWFYARARSYLSNPVALPDLYFYQAPWPAAPIASLVYCIILQKFGFIKRVDKDLESWRFEH